MDRTAFADIYGRYMPALTRYCGRILNHQQDAEDAAQTAMVRAMNALASGPAPERLRPWLFTIAHNEAVSMTRRRKATAVLDEHRLPAVAPADEAAAVRARLRSLVADIQTLPERQRRSIVLRELDGRSYEHIADELGTTVGAVHQTVYEGRRSLRRWARDVATFGPIAALGRLFGESTRRVAELGVAKLAAVGVLATAGAGGGVAVQASEAPERPAPRATAPVRTPAVLTAAPVRPDAARPQRRVTTGAPASRRRVVSTRVERARRAETPRGITGASLPAHAPAAAAPVHADSAADPRPRPDRPAPPPTPSPQPPPSSTPSADAPQPPAATPPAPVEAVSETVRQVTESTATTVDKTVSTVKDVTGALLP